MARCPSAGNGLLHTAALLAASRSEQATLCKLEPDTIDLTVIGSA